MNVAPSGVPLLPQPLGNLPTVNAVAKEGGDGFCGDAEFPMSDPTVTCLENFLSGHSGTVGTGLGTSGY